MSSRIAAVLGLIAFATCVVQGIIVENSFGTVIWRALQALVVTLILGGIIGVMLGKMLDENLGKQANVENSGTEPESASR